MPMTQTRRNFLTTLSLAGAAGLVRTPRSLAAEGALETATVRVLKFPGICVAPQYVAEELLRAEGFSDIRYVDAGAGGFASIPFVEAGPSVDYSVHVGRGEADFSLDFAARIVQAIDDGGAIAV